MPAPPMPIQARPAPRYFAASGSMICAPLWDCDWVVSSVAGVKGIGQVDAGQYHKDIGLQEGDEELEGGDCNGEYERHGRAEHTKHPEAADHDDERAEELERD